MYSHLTNFTEFGHLPHRVAKSAAVFADGPLAKSGRLTRLKLPIEEFTVGFGNVSAQQELCIIGRLIK